MTRFIKGLQALLAQPLFARLKALAAADFKRKMVASKAALSPLIQSNGTTD